MILIKVALFPKGKFTCVLISQMNFRSVILKKMETLNVKIHVRPDILDELLEAILMKMAKSKTKNTFTWC